MDFGINKSCIVTDVDTIQLITLLFDKESFQYFILVVMLLMESSLMKEDNFVLPYTQKDKMSVMKESKKMKKY